MFQKFYESSYDRKLGASRHGRKSSKEEKGTMPSTSQDI